MNSSEHQPVVSVCIQTYQHAAYIKECLDSVIKQKTNFPIEIILGEDNSDDGTREICIEYANKYPSFIHLFLRLEKDKIFVNGEKTGRFNFLENLKAAQGKYIAWLDGDDFWLTDNKLQKQVDYMNANPDCSMSFHKSMKCWENEKPYLNDSNMPDADTKFTLADFLKENKINTVSAMFLKKHVDNLPSWFCQLPFIDFPLFVHIAQKGKIGYIAETMSVYRIHSHGFWSSNRAPGNFIRGWHLLSIMAKNTEGEVKVAMEMKRFKTGIDLIEFYKNRLWEKGDWFRKELEENFFKQDEILLEKFILSPGIKNYLLNAWFFAKMIARKIIKGS